MAPKKQVKATLSVQDGETVPPTRNMPPRAAKRGTTPELPDKPVVTKKSPKLDVEPKSKVTEKKAKPAKKTKASKDIAESAIQEIEEPFVEDSDLNGVGDSNAVVPTKASQKKKADPESTRSRRQPSTDTKKAAPASKAKKTSKAATKVVDVRAGGDTAEMNNEDMEEESEPPVATVVKKRGQKAASNDVLPNGDKHKVETEQPIAVTSKKRGAKGVTNHMPANDIETKNADEQNHIAAASKKDGPKKGTSSATVKVDKRKRTAAAAQLNGDDEEDSETEAPKGGRRAAKKRSSSKSGAAATSGKKSGSSTKNATDTDWSAIDFGRYNCDRGEANLKITAWNVNGLRSWMDKGGLAILEHEKPHIICLQETKLNKDNVPDELVPEYQGYHTYFCFSDRPGYAGVALFSKIMPIEVKYGINAKEQDDEGRAITAEYEKFFLVNVYVPNAGRKLVTLPKRLEWNRAFKLYIDQLETLKPVIICGDFNVAHQEIDLQNPKSNTKNAGFTKEEREGFTEFLDDGRFVDTFRKLYPNEKKAYTFWTFMANARAKDVGWRLDYFVLSQKLMPNLLDHVIRKKVMGSDHCPITIFMRQ